MQVNQVAVTGHQICVCKDKNSKKEKENNFSENYLLFTTSFIALMERGTKEFLYLFVLAEGVTKRRPEGSNTYSWLSGCVTSLWMDLVSVRILELKTTSRLLNVTPATLEAVFTILSSEFLFLTGRFPYQQMIPKEITDSYVHIC